jgi:amidase
MSPDQEVADAFGRVWAVHAAGIPVEEEDEELLMPFTRYQRERGRRVTGMELLAALKMFRGIGQMLADFVFSAYDVMLTPTLATPPALIGAFSSDVDQAADYDRMTAFMPYTPVHNIAGLPAISLPLHRNAAGLPIGVMIGGRYGEEGALLELAAEMQTLAGRRERLPVLAR